MLTGIFGGSFDPVHNGHLAVAAEALRQCGLDEVWLMVSPENPLKSGRLHAPEADRLEMARIAVESLPPELRGRITVSDFEFSLPRPSYTIDTLRALREKFPGREFRWIGGSDNLLSLSRWKNPESILHDYGLIIYPRPGAVIPDRLPEGVEILHGVKEFPYSSTQVREMLGGSGTCHVIPVPGGVKEYIRTHPNLYGV